MPLTEYTKYPAHDTLHRIVHGKTMFTSDEHTYKGKVKYEHTVIKSSIENVESRSTLDTPSFTALSIDHEISQVTTTGTTGPRVGETNQVTLADGESGQEKNVVLSSKGHADDTLSIIPIHGTTMSIEDIDANITFLFLNGEWITKNIGALAGGVVGDIDGGVF